MRTSTGKALAFAGTLLLAGCVDAPATWVVSLHAPGKVAALSDMERFPFDLRLNGILVRIASSVDIDVVGDGDGRLRLDGGEEGVRFFWRFPGCSATVTGPDGEAEKHNAYAGLMSGEVYQVQLAGPCHANATFGPAQRLSR